MRHTSINLRSLPSIQGTSYRRAKNVPLRRANHVQGWSKWKCTKNVFQVRVKNVQNGRHED